MTLGAAVFFGTTSRRFDWRQPLSPNAWTCIGGLSIPLWATWPALSLQTRGIPAFECAAISFLVASLVLGRMERPAVTSGADAGSWRSWIPALAFGFAEAGSGVCFL
jgi:hypothetical protein